jgi:flagellar export protein FliJ
MRLEELNGELAELRNRYRSAAEPGMLNVDALMDAQRYELVMKGERDVVQGQLQTLASETERRRQALIAADREVRVLEKLRETQQERHRAVEARAEMKTLDEIAGRRVSLEETA